VSALKLGLGLLQATKEKNRKLDALDQKNRDLLIIDLHNKI
jgi:hypothetical protein